MIYLDTSWLVKLYIDEPDSVAVRKLVYADRDVAVSELAYAEFHSALARRRREATIDSHAAARLAALFEDEWPTRFRSPLSFDVVARAAELLGKHPLRTLDALHLASALLIAEVAPETPKFGAADARLLAAAKAEGLEALAPR